MVSPAVPVITPADRSNSPPIISRATATAMMPMVEAGSSQLATPAPLRNTSESAAKNTNTITAPMSAPSSGLSSSRRSTPILAIRSSMGASAPSAVIDPLLAGAGPRPAPPRAAQRVPALARSATLAAFSFVTKPGPVSTGRPPPTVFALDL